MDVNPILQMRTLRLRDEITFPSSKNQQGSGGPGFKPHYLKCRPRARGTQVSAGGLLEARILRPTESDPARCPGDSCARSR